MLAVFRQNNNLNYCVLLFFFAIIAGCTILSQESDFNQAKGCNDIGILLPATGAESVRWEQYDRHHLESGIIRKIPGVTIRYFNANSNHDIQEKQADLALKKGSCILIIAPVDSKKASTFVQKAKQKGVPVISYDRFIDDKDVFFYIGFDNKKVGELQAEYVINEFNKKEQGIYNLKEGSNLVMINGAKTDPNTKAIQEGWFEKLNSHFDDKTLNLVFPNGKDDPEYFMDNWDGELAAKKVEELLRERQGDIQIILVGNDAMANEVIKILGDKTGKILITGQDGSLGSAINIVKNYQGITIYKPIEDIAAKTVETVVALSNGYDTNSLINNTDIKSQVKTIPAHLLVPIAVTKDDIEKTLIEDDLFTKEKLCKGIQGICP